MTAPQIDTDEAVRFLRLLDPLSVAFTFQTFGEKGDGAHAVFPRVVHTRSFAELRRAHADGAGIYVCINETDGSGRASENIVAIRAVWQEDDGGYDGQFPLTPSLVVETSPGHFHRYWLIGDDWPADEQGRADFAAVMARMVATYQSDKNAKDISRVLRVPGFWHRKSVPFMVRIIEATGKSYSRAEIVAAFPPIPRQQHKPRDYNPRDGDDERIREALRYIAADDRDIWLQVGMALKDEMGDGGRPLWDEWSRRSDKYNERDQHKTWHSLRGHGIGIGTLFHYAQAAGWRDTHAKGNKMSGDDPSPGTKTKKRKAILIRASTLKPEAIRWAWRNRLAFGKMAMFAGDPGLGKSTVLIDIVALHTKGGPFPCGEGSAEPCETVYLTAEDGLRDTLIPRLIAADADLDKVHFLTGTRVEGASSDDTDAMFDIAKDVSVLREVFEANPDIRILVIDPITAYLGAGTKAKENTEVRRVLTPLIKLIDQFGILLLSNNHLNKNAGKALYRILDSIAFVALGRIVHVVAEDAETPDLKKLLCSKTNIGSRPRGLSYIIQQVWIKGEDGEEIETTRISWGTQYVDETADEALAGNSGEATATDDAVELLLMIFAEAKGPVKVKDIEAEARAACLLGDDKEIRWSKPFRKARDRLGVVLSREGFGPGAVCYWSLPDDPIRAPSAKPSYAKERSPMDGKGTHGGSSSSSSSNACPRTSYVPSSVGKSESGDKAPMPPPDDDDIRQLTISTARTDLEAIHDELRLRGDWPLNGKPDLTLGSSI
jgi:hypothetical protein